MRRGTLHAGAMALRIVRHPRIAGCAALAMSMLALLPVSARAVNTGDLVVADISGKSGLVFVDHVTGAQHLLAGSPDGHGYLDVTSNASGAVYAIGSGSPTVYSIDTVNGTSTLLTSGASLQSVRTIDFSVDGNLYVAQGGSATGGVIRVDPGTGTQSVVMSGNVRALAIDPSGVGYIALVDGAIAPAKHLYRLDLGTGQTVKISNTAFYDPLGLAVDMSGNIILTESGSLSGVPAVWRVDPATGAAAIVSSGGQFMTPFGVTVETNGTIVIADDQHLNSCDQTPPAPSTCPGALFRVDPVTGSQMIVTEKELFYNIWGVDVYRGPNVPTPTRRTTWGRLKSIYR